MTKPRPKTGEKRVTQLPLKIDRLPQSALDAIAHLRDCGVPWPRIEAQSAKPYSKDWKTDGGGFIDWESLDLSVLEEFPAMRLPKSSLHRWYDLRIRQVHDQVLKESAIAREWASAFAAKNLPESNAAVINAMRDQVFNLMQGVGEMDKAKFIGALGDLTLAMARIQRVEIQARKVAVEEKTIQMKLDLVKQKAESLIGDIEGRDGKPAIALTREDLLEKVREIYGAV